MKLLEIAQAWLISFHPTNEQRIIAEHRLDICNQCEHSKYMTQFDIHVCDACGCPIKKKVFATNKDSCPKKKWNK